MQRRTSTTGVYTVYECYRHSYRAISNENSKRIVDQSLERRPRFLLATIVGIAESLEQRICKSLRKAPKNSVKNGNGIESRHLILFNWFGIEELRKRLNRAYRTYSEKRINQFFLYLFKLKKFLLQFKLNQFKLKSLIQTANLSWFKGFHFLHNFFARFKAVP